MQDVVYFFKEKDFPTDFSEEQCLFSNWNKCFPRRNLIYFSEKRVTDVLEATSGLQPKEAVVERCSVKRCS